MTSGPAPQSALRIEPITTRAVPIQCPNCAMLLALAWAEIGDHIRDLWPAFRAAVMAANGQAEVPSHARRT